MRYTHVVFDIDETLVHSASSALVGLDRLLEKRGLPARTPEQRRMGVGATPPSVERELGIAVDEGFVEEWVDEITPVYAREARLFDGVETMLRTLASDGVSLGIVTNELSREVRQNFGQLGVLTCFSTIVARDDCLSAKPGPEPLIAYCEQAGARPDQVLYVGDSETDAACARAADVDFALCCWGASPSHRHIRAVSYAMSPWHVVELVRRERSVDEREPWLSWARELEAIAQAGLWYGRDPYDVERFGRIREMACDVMTRLSGLPLERLEGLFADEEGYQTPKLDTRAVIFDDEGRICLVNERQGGWALPGGWLDQGQTAQSNAVKEAREEAGLEVVPSRVIALQEHNLHNEHPFAWGILKVFVMCEPVGGEFSENVETIERGFFSRDQLPEPILAAKSTREQIEMCFAAYDAGSSWEMVVD